MGPFPVISRPSRSTIEIKVGLNKDGSDRREIRHISDIKVAYLRDDAVIASRPKRGRPPKAPTTASSKNSTSPDSEENKNKNDANTKAFSSPNLDDDPPFHGFGTQAAIDFQDPKRARNSNAWQATAEDLRKINQSIQRGSL